MAAKKRSKNKTKKNVKKAKKQQKMALKPKQKKNVKRKVSKPVAKSKKPQAARGASSEKAEIKRQAEKKEKAPVSTGERAEVLRKLLIQKREQIVKEAKVEISKYIKGETRQLVDTALDDGDWSVVDLSEDISLRQLGAHKEMLVKIDAALVKLQEGTYGICEDCGGKISKERLKVLPFAIYCKDCQEKIEQFEAIAKELQI